MFVWLASYPKSGNTWLRAALSSLRQDGDAVDFAGMAEMGRAIAQRMLFERVLGVESSDLSRDQIDDLRPAAIEALGAARRSLMPRKVHEAWRRTRAGIPIFPASITAGTIYVVRDPRAVVPSWAHHAQISIDDAIAFLADPKATLGATMDRGTPHLPEPLSTWSGHVDSWQTGPTPSAETIRYEDMLDDPVRELGRAAHVLGWPAERSTLERAAAASRFDVLRATERAQGFKEKAPGASAFFRRGRADGWRDELTAAQIARIERDHESVMRRLGYL